MESLIQVFIYRNGIEEAQIILDDMLDQLDSGEDAEEILYGYGLEPDYIEDLLDYRQGRMYNAKFQRP
jgi:uncharacterized protein (DUF433 family)